MKKLALTAALFLAATVYANAATCTEEVYVPEVLDCSNNSDKSFADFSKGGCNFTPARIDTIEKECPYQWVNVSGTALINGTPTPTQASVCASAGMKPTSIDGVTCASGYYRVKDIGEGWESINYRYGRYGSRTGGGTKVGSATIRGEGYCSGGENGSDYSNCSDGPVIGHSLVCMRSGDNLRYMNQNWYAVVAFACTKG